MDSLTAMQWPWQWTACVMDVTAMNDVFMVDDLAMGSNGWSQGQGSEGGATTASNGKFVHWTTPQ